MLEKGSKNAHCFNSSRTQTHTQVARQPGFRIDYFRGPTTGQPEASNVGQTLKKATITGIAGSGRKRFTQKLSRKKNLASSNSFCFSDPRHIDPPFRWKISCHKICTRIGLVLDCSVEWVRPPRRVHSSTRSHVLEELNGLLRNPAHFASVQEGWRFRVCFKCQIPVCGCSLCRVVFYLEISRERVGRYDLSSTRLTGEFIQRPYIRPSTCKSDRHPWPVLTF